MENCHTLYRALTSESGNRTLTVCINSQHGTPVEHLRNTKRRQRKKRRQSETSTTLKRKRLFTFSAPNYSPSSLLEYCTRTLIYSLYICIPESIYALRPFINVRYFVRINDGQNCNFSPYTKVYTSNTEFRRDP